MKTTKVSDLLRKTSSSIKLSDVCGTGTYPVYGAQGIVGYLDSYQTPREALSVIKDGAGVGRVGRIPEKSSVLSTLQILTPTPSICDLTYGYYLLKSLNLGVDSVGATIPHIYFKDYGERTIPGRDIDEQRQISRTLFNIESEIKSSESQISYCDELIKSRFNEMFSACKTIKSIGELAKICRGASPRPIQSYITKNPSGINWIKIGDAKNDEMFITSTSEKITTEGALKSRKVNIGDFILSNSMSFGKPYILKIDGCIHDGWLIISNYEQYLNPIYFYYELRSNDVQSQFNESASGTTVRNLNSDLVRKTLIKFPPLSLQNEFAFFVEKVDKLKFVGVSWGVAVFEVGNQKQTSI